MKIACRPAFSLVEPHPPFLSSLCQLGLRIATSSATAPRQKTRLSLKAKHQDAFNSLQAIKGHKEHFIQRLQGCTSLQCRQVDMPVVCLWFIWLLRASEVAIIKKRNVCKMFDSKLVRFCLHIGAVCTYGENVSEIDSVASSGFRQSHAK